MKTQLAIKNRLREAARAVGAVADRWVLQTSNSFRRIGTPRGDGNVLRGHVQQHDGHPDLVGSPGVLDYIVAAQPSVMISLLEDLEAAERKSQQVHTVVDWVISKIDEISARGVDPRLMGLVLASFRTALASIQPLFSAAQSSTDERIVECEVAVQDSTETSIARKVEA